MSAPPPGLYGRLARTILAHRLATIIIVALVTAVSAVFMSRLHVDSDILALMPQDEPSTQALERLDRQEGGINLLTIAVESDDKPARDAFLDDLAGRIEKMPEIDYVLYKLDPQTALRLGLLQIPTSDLTNLHDRLQAAIALGPTIANPLIAARLFDLGPLTKRLETAGSPIHLGNSEKIGRLLVRPKGSAHDLPFARKFMADVQEAITAADAPGHGVTIKWIGGAYRHNVEDYEAIVRDIGWITVASFVLVLAIIGGAFRSVRSVFIIFIPLTLSNIWALGVAGATVGSLNTFTSFVNAVLIGLGVEFGVHLLARYRELREAGHEVDDAIIRAWDLVGSACTSAAFTAAAGFAALLAAHFAGFQQLGWLLSLGLLLCLVGVIVCMPILIAWLDHDHTAPAPSRHRRQRRRRQIRSYRMAPAALLVLGSFTVISALLIPRIQFEFDLSELRRSGLAYQDLSDSERDLARESYSPLIVTYPTQEALDAGYDKLKRRVDDGKFPEISTVLSVRTVIPKDQEEKLAILRQIVELGKDPTAAYLPAAVRQNIGLLNGVSLDPLTPADLPTALQHVLGAANGQHRLLLLPSGNMWDMRECANLSAAIDRELAGQEVAGEYMTLGVLYRLLLHDAPIIGAIAFGLVVFFTFADLRSFRSTAGAVAVLIAGVAWWGALLVAAGIKISIVNFVGMPIVLGIGIDVMIHLIHRLHQEGPGRIQKTLSTTGWASALGTSTTVVAFAALSLASSQGIRSLGLLVLLGEMAVTIAGFVLVPLGFATAWSLQGRHPAPSEETNPGTHPPEGS